VIVIDTSALIAIHWHEVERPIFRSLISTAERRWLPSSSYLEFAFVTRWRPESRQWLDRMIDIQGLEIVALDAAIARVAASAAKSFGHIAGHPARLNFGDCLSYAVARHLGAPLLYKGDDFIHTDIESALPP